jgi:hypothetical protein
MDDEAPGRRRLCGAYMLCCTCEVNRKMVHRNMKTCPAILQASAVRSFGVNYVFHNLYM